jgi:hypothetical protein
MTNLDSLRKHLTNLTDEAILEVSPGDLTEEAKAVYDAELASRNLSWPSVETVEESVVPAGFPDPADGELQRIARYETFAEARFALTLLRQEQIPVWVAGTTTPGVTMIDPNAPIDLVTTAEHLESAQLLLSSEISDEELALLAEQAGDPEENNA